MVEVQEYLDRSGRSPFARWFEELNAPAAAKVAIALTRIGQGNFSNVKVSGPESMNIASTLALVTASTSARTVTGS